MGTSTSANPTYQYTIPGVYDVTLTVYGLGGTTSYTRSGYITVNTPVLDVTLGSINPAASATLTGLGSYTYNAVGTLTATPGGSGTIDYADIVFLVPQPDDLQTAVLASVPGMITELETGLNAAGIGIGVNPNNYALVGFMDGTTSPVDKPTKKSVGGGDWGTAAQCVTAVNALAFPFTFASQKSDGYYACEFALSNYTFRSGAPKIFVLYSRKGRQDITGGVVTDATSSAALTAANVILNVVLINFSITDTNPADVVFSRVGLTSQTYIDSGAPPYYSGTGVFSSWADIATLPPLKSITYAPWCGALDGYIWLWDKTAYTGFQNAFGDLNASRVTIQIGTLYTFDYFVLNGGSHISTNPYAFNVVVDTVVDVYLT